MLRFLKAQLASFIGTVVDFLTTIVSVEILGVWYVLGTFLGNVLGGIANFYLGRNWVFKATGKKIKVQAFRYIIVWIGSILLNTSGVYLLTHYFQVQYIISKVIVSLAVAFAYNYLLQRYFVFKLS